jgi:hypothetical protein
VDFIGFYGLELGEVYWSRMLENPQDVDMWVII